jgi:site-specific DNA recombinase
METKLILIARVSDIEQRKALPAQKLRLERYAEQKQLPSEYHEFDESAHKDVRQKFAKLVEHIHKQTSLCYVVFDKIDRFTRDSSQEEVKALQQLVKQGKIELHFPNDSLYIDKNSSAADWFRLGIGMALAKYYSDSIRDNVKRRFEQMLSEGIWVHRAPVGYKNVLKGGTPQKPLKDIEVDDAKAHYIVKAYEMRARGVSYAVIAKELREMGFRSNIAGSKAPSKQFLERILSNEFYCGFMVHAGRRYPHKYPPLISRGLYNQVQRVRDERKHEKTKYDSKDFTLKKIVKCGYCGRAVSPFKARNTVYLRCANTKCQNPNTAVSLVIDEVAADIGFIDVPESWLENVIAELRNRHNDQQLYFTQNIEQTRAEYDKLKEKMRKVYYDLLEGRITQTFHDDIATELEKKQQELNDRLKLLTSDNKDFQVTASYLLDLAQRAEQLFKESDEGLRQKLLEYVLSNIELKDKKLSYILNDPFKSVVEAKKKSLSAHNSNVWCSIVDAFQTAAQLAQEDYKLKHLAEQFRLADNLI